MQGFRVFPEASSKVQSSKLSWSSGKVWIACLDFWVLRFLGFWMIYCFVCLG